MRKVQLLCLVLAFSLVCKIARATPYSAILIDADTKEILYEKDSSIRQYPASLTKMMTMYVAFDEIKKRRLKFSDIAIISRKASRQPQLIIGLRVGTKIKVRDLIESMIVRSANDSSVALAEKIAGSEQKFVTMMNRKAYELGMYSTRFANAAGLHNSNQYTTAQDMARLSISLWKNHAEFFHMFSIKKFQFKNKVYKSHNYVLMDYPGARGIKTGYVRASGYNISSFATRDGHNILAVTMHVGQRKVRDDFTMNLLDYGFKKAKYLDGLQGGKKKRDTKRKKGIDQVVTFDNQAVQTPEQNVKQADEISDIIMKSSINGGDGNKEDGTAATEEVVE